MVRGADGGVLADDRAAFVWDAGLLPADRLALADQGGARADCPAGLVHYAAFEPDRAVSRAGDGGDFDRGDVRGGGCGDAVFVAAGAAGGAKYREDAKTRSVFMKHNGHDEHNADCALLLSLRKRGHTRRCQWHANLFVSI